MRVLNSALDNWEDKDRCPIFKFREVTLAKMNALISILSSSNSAGHGGLTSLPIKAASGKLLRPVQHIINTSLLSKTFAMKWKLSVVIPRLKSKDLDRTSTSSYRPISLLPTTLKLVERAAQQQLLLFMEETKQLNMSSHVYRKNMSTTTTLTDIFDDIYMGAEENKFMSLMSVDQSSAFDCVDKPMLLDKLEKYNIGSDMRQWIDSYLSDRIQYVQIGTGQSRMAPVNCGVPQGSMIGPLLYVLLTNGITEAVKDRECQLDAHKNSERLFGGQCNKCGSLSIYADDTTYIVSNKMREGN